MIHCSSLEEACSFRTRVGRATLRMVLSTLTIKTEEHSTTNAAQRRAGDIVAGRVARLTGSLHLRGRWRARVEGHFVASVPLNPLGCAWQRRASGERSCSERCRVAPQLPSLSGGWGE